MNELIAPRNAYGEALNELYNEIDNLVVMDADLAHATMTCLFANEHRDRFINAGIAEQNLMGMAAGIALSGNCVFASTFALFGAGRAFELVRNSICYTNANVKLALTHGGLSAGEDGGSHQSVEDIALMRAVPNMRIIAPCDAVETKQAVKAAAKSYGPVYLRIPRIPVPVITKADSEFEIGKGKVIKDGSDVAILSMGLVLHEALKASEMLAKDGIDAAVIDIHTIKPIDSEIILKYAGKCKLVVTAEEHSIIGGLGSAIAEVIAGKGSVQFMRIGIEDKFGKTGKPSELFADYGIDAYGIYSKIKASIG